MYYPTKFDTVEFDSRFYGISSTVTVSGSARKVQVGFWVVPQVVTHETAHL